MNGLVIKSPWIDRILQTSCTWLLRGSRTSAHGQVALIKARSGLIVGTAKIVNCVGPMTPDELRAEAAKQQVAIEALATSPTAAKAYAWVLSDIKPLAQPIAYKHPIGSVVWVKLTAENVPARYNELEATAPVAPVATPVAPAAPSVAPAAPACGCECAATAQPAVAAEPVAAVAESSAV